MNIPISKSTASHYVWAQVCDGWRLVNEKHLSVIEERVPAGAAEIRHYHKVARQFFYILEGAAVMEIEGTDYVLSAGFGIEVSPGNRHRFSNPNLAEVRFLVISSPSTAEDRFNDI